VGTERSSVELDNRPPVEAKELVSRLEDTLKEGEQDQSVVGKERRSREVVKRCVYKAPLRYSSKPSSSYLPSGFRPKSLQVLAALLSHQSLHTINIPVLGKSRLDISWSLSGLGLAGLPLMKTVRGKPLRSLPGCRGTTSKSLKYISDANEGAEEKR